MRVIVQRVKSASVTVDDKVISQIGRGLLLLVGFGTGDTQHELNHCVKKILATKFFPSALSCWGWEQNIIESKFEILSISQFTLYANIKRGSKPDFHGSMGGPEAETMYINFLEALRQQYSPELIKDGKFGAMMDVSLVNDGPVTIIIDSIDGPKLQPEGNSDIKDEKNRIKKEARLARIESQKKLVDDSEVL